MGAFTHTSMGTWMSILDGLIEKHGVTDGLALLRGIVINMYYGTDEEYNTIMEAWEAREVAMEGLYGDCDVIDCETC